MKRVAVLSTVKSVMELFEKMIRSEMLDVKLSNTFDDFLAADVNEKGEFTKDNKRRLFNILEAMQMTGADVIVVSCSTLTPVVEQLRPFFNVPVIAVDDAMCRRAAEIGGKITVMATARSTVDPTISKIRHEADILNKDIIILSEVCEKAFLAMRSGDIKMHDTLLRDAANNVKECDAIVLAQASMAHMSDDISKITGKEVLTSPTLCIGQLKAELSKIK